MSKVVAIVTGSRDALDYGATFRALDDVRPDVVIHGDAGRRFGTQIIGVDQHAGEWARRAGIDLVVVPALWEMRGKAAGPQRNEFMVRVGLGLAEQFKGRLVVVAMPGGTGTGSMTNIARQLGVHVFERAFDGSAKGGA